MVIVTITFPLRVGSVPPLDASCLQADSIPRSEAQFNKSRVVEMVDDIRAIPFRCKGKLVTYRISNSKLAFSVDQEPWKLRGARYRRGFCCVDCCDTITGGSNGC